MIPTPPSRRRFKPAALALALALVAFGLLTVGLGWILQSGVSGHRGYRELRAIAAESPSPRLGSAPPKVSEPEAALQRLGTNAFPGFVRALTVNRRFPEKLENLWASLPVWIRSRIARPPTDDRVREVAMVRAQAWNSDQRESFSQALAPPLLAALQNPSTYRRERLLDPLQEFRLDPRLVVPVLRSLLRDSSPELREGAMVALWNLRPHSGEAIPELIESLSMTNIAVCNLAVLLLGSLGEASKAAVPALERLLETPGIPQDTVAGALWLIDRRTNTALQHLTNRIEDFTGNNAYMLGRMGEAGRPAIPSLLQGLKSKTGNVRMNSARALWKIAPDYLPQAISAVLEPLTNHLEQSGSGLDSQGAAWYAAAVLREFGTHAASARWALEWGSTNSDPNVAAECRKALQAFNP